MSDQYARIELDKALDMYDRRSLTAKGLVEIYFLRSIIPGQPFTKNNVEVIELLGVPERTYYRALAELRAEEIIFHRHTGNTTFALEPETLYKTDKKGKRRSTKTVERTPDRNGSKTDNNGSGDCQSWQSGLTEMAVETDRNGSFTDKLGTETPLKALSGNGCSDSTSSLQLSNIYQSSINQENAPEDEDDDGLILKKEENADDGLMKDFDLWMKKVKIPELIADGVKKPSAYLKSLDKTTGQPLIEKYRAEWETLKSATVKANEFTNIKPKYPIGMTVYHWNSGYSGQVLSYPHKKRALIDVGDDNLLFPVDELYDAPDARSTPTYSSLREALASQFPDLASKS